MYFNRISGELKMVVVYFLMYFNMIKRELKTKIVKFQKNTTNIIGNYIKLLGFFTMGINPGAPVKAGSEGINTPGGNSFFPTVLRFFVFGLIAVVIFPTGFFHRR